MKPMPNSFPRPLFFPRIIDGETPCERGWSISCLVQCFVETLGRDPFNQNFRKFRSKTQWIGSVQPEKFGKNGSTFWGGPLFPVGPVGILVEWIAPLVTWIEVGTNIAFATMKTNYVLSDYLYCLLIHSLATGFKLTYSSNEYCSKSENSYKLILDFGFSETDKWQNDVYPVESFTSFL